MGDASARDEEIRQLRATLRKMRHEISELSLRNEELEKELRRANRTVAGAWEQINVMRHSSSWQMTAPVRALKTVLRGVLR
ncbi:methyltransferase [Actinomyces sp. 432]|nr:coiled-coil domain-containing protein 22 [Actinomyces sp. 594]NDR52596.1 coiled-coil domain-containing protein 22 [Actinomyces sp. 565]QHO92296.1 methyltransferase [Actinomyces sp. 432]